MRNILNYNSSTNDKYHLGWNGNNLGALKESLAEMRVIMSLRHSRKSFSYERSRLSRSSDISPDAGWAWYYASAERYGLE